MDRFFKKLEYFGNFYNAGPFRVFVKNNIIYKHFGLRKPNEMRKRKKTQNMQKKKE
jgi:hypothetical protein